MKTLWRAACCSLFGIAAYDGGASATLGSHRHADPPVKVGKVELVIGGQNEQREGYEFGYVSGLDFDPQGRIFVSDSKEINVRAFSSTGTLLFTMGRKGAGPGEFESPQNIAVASDGLLWVEDGGNRRFTVLNPVPPVGKVIRSFPRNSNRGALDRIHWDAAGNVVSSQITAARKPGQELRVVRTFVNGAGETVRADTAPDISPDSSDSWTIASNGGVAKYSKPFSAQRLSAFGGLGFAAFATNTRYAVLIVDSNGRQVALVKRELPAIKLGAAEVEAFAAAKSESPRNCDCRSLRLRATHRKTNPRLPGCGLTVMADCGSSRLCARVRCTKRMCMRLTVDGSPSERGRPMCR